MLPAPDTSRIIIVEDELSLREDLAEYLSKQGFLVATAATIGEFRQVVVNSAPALVLLDISLPDGSGLDLARELRTTSDIKIVILTNHGALNDKITGLESGADAYLVKHTDLREIDATIRSVLRRSANNPQTFWSYDQITWRLTAPNGAAIKLTATETAFISILLRTPGRSVQRDEIARSLPRPRESSERSLDSMVKRLRKKIEQAAGVQFPVTVVYGVGYSFTAPVKLT